MYLELVILFYCLSVGPTPCYGPSSGLSSSPGPGPGPHPVKTLVRAMVLVSILVPVVNWWSRQIYDPDHGPDPGLCIGGNIVVLSIPSGEFPLLSST